MFTQTPIPTPLPTAPVLHPIQDHMGSGPVVNLDAIGDLLRQIKFWVNAPFDHIMHFLLAFCAGLLAYYLTWITLSLAVSALDALRPGGKSLVARLGFSMNLCSWSVALSCAFASHLWWDGLF